MLTIDFKGIVKNDENAYWYAEDKNGKIIDEDFLSGIDNYLESLGIDILHENESIEIIIKLSERKEDQKW